MHLTDRAADRPARRPAGRGPDQRSRGAVDAEPPDAPDLYGEYSSPRLRLPGWGLASLLFALPGASLPWLLPAILGRIPWQVARPYLLIVPVSALIGTLFGAVGVRREDGGVASLVGLALNVVLLLLVAAVLVILLF